MVKRHLCTKGPEPPHLRLVSDLLTVASSTLVFYEPTKVAKSFLTLVYQKVVKIFAYYIHCLFLEIIINLNQEQAWIPR